MRAITRYYPKASSSSTFRKRTLSHDLPSRGGARIDLATLALESAKKDFYTVAGTHAKSYMGRSNVV